MKCPITHQNCLNGCKWSLKNGTCAVPLIAVAMSNIAASLESIASEAKRGNNVLEQQALSVAEIAEKGDAGEAVQRSDGDCYKEAVKPPAKPRLANENDITVWLDSMSVESTMNNPTASVYERFERWCGSKSITPIGRRTITNRVRDRFKYAIGYYDTAKNEPVFLPTSETFEKR